ncbi:hypothetical protein CN445_17855 [Bacillus cereus]|uniref:hypothetical protein n=1 Tax=Bacillus nitratireducens TaxID=2026193 RepID=UPI0002FD0F63|nr:hypothetical protein [Bacillus nitratireducens]EOP52331.1 hypothetical protein IKQ_03019 [Bacillus cereus VDM053]PEB79790.1 hypothetical protein COM95_19240 [Bacillus cereus]OJD39491.1 hypothetical protein BAU23_02400 [Bacillus nitratireducens]PEW85739.1 hypothetical protein CN445_17855 [Bacillus cereus]PFH75838.1 hypothetical protein COI61_18610 [Bacillus cereus]
MKRTIMKYSIMFSLLLLTSCDITDEELEQKAQSYTKSEYGISVKLNQVETLDNGKDFLGPKWRIVSVQQVDEPYLQFQFSFEGQISPKVNNDNYKIKKEANDLQERFNTYYEKKENNTILIFAQIQAGDTVFDKNAEKEIAKKNLKQYYTAVFRSNTVLDVNNPVHMETLAEAARSMKEFNKMIENSKSSVEDITIQLPDVNKDVLKNIAVDYILTAEDAKKTLEKKADYMKVLQSTK